MGKRYEQQCHNAHIAQSLEYKSRYQNGKRNEQQCHIAHIAQSLEYKSRYQNGEEV